MISRIHHDDKFLTFEIPTREVLDKLGREYPFHINRSPISYESVWKPLHILFRASEKYTQEIIPDLAEVDGKLFLNEKAFDALKSILAEHGEFLPVTYDAGSGYIFNILDIVEDRNALNEKLTGYDQHGNLSHFEFEEGRLKNVSIFRAKIDNYNGIFCTDIFKTAIEDAKLCGIHTHPDLSNLTGSQPPSIPSH